VVGTSKHRPNTGITRPFFAPPARFIGTAGMHVDQQAPAQFAVQRGLC
jgi:hypothetical protein